MKVQWQVTVGDLDVAVRWCTWASPSRASAVTFLADGLSFSPERHIINPAESPGKMDTPFSMNELPFTGERYIPALKGQIAYEHIHRYALCAALVTGRRVLDIACGEGYGSSFMARTAMSVIGVDVDPNTIHHAEVAYQSIGNLSFRVGDCRAIPLPSDSVDMVISFETIEHVAEQDATIAEIKRVLTSTGTLIISSPDRHTYNEKIGHVNEFHVCELTKKEFQDLLARHFKTVRMHGQRIAIGSFVIPELAQDCRTFDAFMRGTRGFESGVANLAAPVYYIAVCSDNVQAMPTLGPSIYVDPEDDLLDEHNFRQAEAAFRAAEAAFRAEEARLSGELTRALQRLDQDERSFSEARAAFHAEEGRLVTELTKADLALRDQEQLFRIQETKLRGDLETQSANARSDLDALEALLNERTRDRDRVLQSLSWRVTHPLRKVAAWFGLQMG